MLFEDQCSNLQTACIYKTLSNYVLTMSHSHFLCLAPTRTAQLKTTLGLEFIRAHQAILQLNNEAGGTHPTQLILADVAVDVTLRRCWGVLTRFQKLRVCWYILTGLVFGKVRQRRTKEDHRFSRFFLASISTTLDTCYCGTLHHHDRLVHCQFP